MLPDKKAIEETLLNMLENDLWFCRYLKNNYRRSIYEGIALIILMILGFVYSFIGVVLTDSFSTDLATILYLIFPFGFFVLMILTFCGIMEDIGRYKYYCREVKRVESEINTKIK